MTTGSFYQNYREVTLLVVHCSATRYDRNFPVEALHRCHLARGFASIGYHSISRVMAKCTFVALFIKSGHTRQDGTIKV